MKKTKWISALLVLVCVAAMCALAGCEDGKTDTTAHEHTFAVTWSKDETHHWHACTADGCTEKSDYAVHDTVGVGGVCSKCGYKAAVTPAKHTHSYATAWEHGKTHHWHACTVAGCDSKGEYAAHVWTDGDVTKAPTCTEKGEQMQTCVCGATKTKELDVAPAAHSFADTWEKDETEHWHAATCVHTTEKKDTAAHTWDEGTVTKAANCTEAGEKTFTCTVCKATKVEPIPVDANAHNFTSAWSKDGTNHWHVCQNDGCTVKDGDAAHDWNDGVVTKEANCTEAGEKTYTCTVCQASKTEPIEIVADAHDFATTWTHDETNHWHACQNGCAAKDGEAAHTWDDGVITKEPCDTDGEKTYTCTVCKATKTEAVQNVLTEVAVGAHSTTMTLPSGKELKLTNKAVYYQCEHCHKTFAGNDHSKDEIALTDAIGIGSQNYAGPGVVGENTYITAGAKGLLFVAPSNGLYKVTCPTSAVSTIVYYGKTETATPSTIYNKGWQKTAAQFAHFTYNEETPKKDIYVKMQQGEVVGLLYTRLNRVAVVAVEELDASNYPACQMHVGGYDFSALSANGGTLAPTCVNCGTAVGESITYAAYAETGTDPIALSTDTCITKSTGDATYVLTVAEAGDYVLKFGALTSHSIAQGTKVFKGTAVFAMYMPGMGGWVDSGANPTDIVKSDGGNLTVTLASAAAGDEYKVVISVDGASTTDPVYRTACYEATITGGGDDPSPSGTTLIFGDTQVAVTGDIDNGTKCVFTPTETKAYAITVPAGVSVYPDEGGSASMSALIDNGEGTESASANFDGTADTPIILWIFGSTETTVTVTIGEAVTLPTLDLEHSYHIEDYPAFGDSVKFRIGDSVSDGDYILSMTDTMWRATVYIAINFTGTIEKNGSNVVMQDGWITMTAMAPNNQKTIHVKGGDIITVINPIQGTADVTFALTAA